MTTIPLAVTENLCRTLEFVLKGKDKAQRGPLRLGPDTYGSC